MLHKCQQYLWRIVIDLHALAQVHRHCTEVGLTQEEQEVRSQALYIIDNLNLVNLAMRLCDFKDIHMAVEAKQVRTHPCWTLESHGPSCKWHVCMLAQSPLRLEHTSLAGFCLE